MCGLTAELTRVGEVCGISSQNPNAGQSSRHLNAAMQQRARQLELQIREREENHPICFGNRWRREVWQRQQFVLMGRQDAVSSRLLWGHPFVGCADPSAAVASPNAPGVAEAAPSAAEAGAAAAPTAAEDGTQPVAE